MLFLIAETIQHAVLFKISIWVWNDLYSATNWNDKFNQIDCEDGEHKNTLYDIWRHDLVFKELINSWS